MDWKDIAGVVGKAAPMVGTLLGGPAGRVMGGMVASALGVDNTPDAVQSAIATDPEAALKLAMLQEENRGKLNELTFDHAKAEIAAETARIQADVDDRKSARSREVDAKDSWTPRVLAAVVVGASVGIGTAIVTGYVTKDAALASLLGTVVGYVFGESKQVLSYYFGSSSGSAEKTRILAKTTPAAEPNAENG